MTADGKGRVVQDRWLGRSAEIGWPKTAAQNGRTKADVQSGLSGLGAVGAQLTPRP